MSIFVSATKAPKPKTKNIRPISLLLTGLLVVLAVAQLFTFEDFPARLTDAGISSNLAPLLATFIVTAEVLALPFVLQMPLSPLFRLISMIIGWLVSLKLLTVAIIENLTIPHGTDAVFGATLPLPVGVWSICAALALCVLIGWTSWGLWPLRIKK